MAPTIPLYCLLGYVAWTIGLVVALTVARLRFLGRGGQVREFGIPDERKLVWRLFRAHANATENLPLFASVVLVAAVLGRDRPLLDVLAITCLVGRIGQSLVHVSPGAGHRFNLRFRFLLLQVAAVAAFVIVLALPA